jgi:predicted NBD/HSP70 family sugar kinase
MHLVFDLGGTRSRFALVDKGELQEIVRLDTDRKATGFAKFLGAMEEHVGDRELDSVVGGMAGQLNEHGDLTLTPNLPDWRGLPVLSSLKRIFGDNVRIYNDAVMGGVGEAHYGAGTSKGIMAYFTVSTGTNGVRIVDGVPDPTIGRFEVGHMIMGGVDAQPTDFEDLVGGNALERRTGKPPREIKDEATWKKYAKRLATGMYNTCLFWTPEVIVFGGSMMRDIDLKLVRQYLEEMPDSALQAVPRLERAKLGDTTGLHGALAMATKVRR